MNSPAHASTAADEFARLEKLRTEIQGEMDLLRAQEENLRRYEARLRASGPPPPVAVAPEMQELAVEREKLVRLRTLLEAERRALVDERLALREEKAAIAAQAVALQRRAAWQEKLEHEFKAAQTTGPATAPASWGARLGLREVPFAGFLRSSRRES